MSKQRSVKARRCPVCGAAMRKKGFTKAGSQRRKCDECALSTTAKRSNSQRMAQFRAFLAWVIGKESMNEAAARLGVTRQTFAMSIAWCWNVVPHIAKDGVLHHCVQMDGTYLPYGWCLLVATGEDGKPIAWQWCDRESKAAYRQLFTRVLEPDVLVTRWRAGLSGRCPGTVEARSGATMPGARAA